MRIDRRTVLSAGAALAGAATGGANAATRKSGGGRAEAKALKTLEDYVTAHRASWGLAGLTLAVVGRDGFEGFVTSGLADVGRRTPVAAEQLFQVGSITKMMASLAVWSLIDEGKLKPDDRLATLLPEIQVAGGEAITLQDLLNHTAGLPRDASPFIDGGLWTGFEPGAHWLYSNLGYRLAGMIAARADGRPFAECLEARVFAPLGMTASAGAIRSEDRARYAVGYEPALMDRPSIRPAPMVAAPWEDFQASSGCAAATAGDMAKFLTYLVALGGGAGGPILSDDATSAFLQARADAPGWGRGVQYGNGIAFYESDGREYLHHTGGMVSFCSSLHVDPETGVGAFASANVHYGLAYRPRAITAYACELLRAVQAGEAPPKPTPARPRPANVEKFVGAYTAEDGARVEIALENGALSARADERTGAMQLISGGYFAVDHDAFKLSGLDFEVGGDSVSRVWSGGVEYLRDPSSGYTQTPPDVAALAGLYDNDGRSDLPTRIFARGDKLWAVAGNYNSTLTRLDETTWRAGEQSFSPDRAHFDNFIDGEPQRVVFSGDASYRRNG